MAVKFVTKKDIVRQVKIVDIAKEFGIELESAVYGNFDHRCRCPNKNHKGGAERTASLYIDSVNNNYYCYGCQSSNNCLDFYMICADVSFSEALSILRTRVTEVGSGRDEVALDNFSVMLDISHLFRDTMLKHPKDLKWINSLMKQTDGFLDEISKSEVKKTKALLRKLEIMINERYA